jgi:hypothetical protein
MGAKALYRIFPYGRGPRISAKGRKQRFKLRHYRKAPAKAIAAAPERPASENAM